MYKVYTREGRFIFETKDYTKAKNDVTEFGGVVVDNNGDFVVSNPEWLKAKGR